MSWLLIFRAWIGRITAPLDQGAEGLGSGDRGSAAERQIAGVGDDVLGGISRMAADAEGESHGVAAGDRAMLAQAVRIVDLAQMRARLAMHGIHEKLLRLFAILPCHCCSPGRLEEGTFLSSLFAAAEKCEGSRARTAPLDRQGYNCVWACHNLVAHNAFPDYSLCNTNTRANRERGPDEPLSSLALSPLI